MMLGAGGRVERHTTFGPQLCRVLSGAGRLAVGDSERGPVQAALWSDAGTSRPGLIKGCQRS